VRVPGNHLAHIVILHCKLQTGARLELANVRPVKFFPGRVIGYFGRLELFAAHRRVDVLLSEEEIAVRQVDLDLIAGSEDREVSPNRRFRRDVQNRRTV
jgi:hypothetical protein